MIIKSRIASKTDAIDFIFFSPSEWLR